MEIGRNVTRPVISGLMGAYGAALHAMANEKETSSLISLDELKNFTHKTTSVKCGMCTNHCSLTVSMFPGGRKFISGNRCERPLGGGDKLKRRICMSTSSIVCSSTARASRARRESAFRLDSICLNCAVLAHVPDAFGF